MTTADGCVEPDWRHIERIRGVSAMDGSSARRALHGRIRERAEIDSLIRRTRLGRGGCLVLQGEPGIGKTALLEHAVERADGMRVLSTAGVESEVDIGLAALHRLLLPVLDRLYDLPGPQAHGLRVAFGQASGIAADRFIVSLGALSLLGEIARDQPVLCVVDDAHRIDAASLDIISFIARRLGAQPMSLMMAARTGEGNELDATGLGNLPLAGLERDAARALLIEQSEQKLPPGEQDVLLWAAAGNPLAIREFSMAGMRRFGPYEPLPLTAGLERAFMDRVRPSSAAQRTVLLLVAAAGTRRLDIIGKAAAALGSRSAAPLTSGVLDDLLIVDELTVTYRHPLVRSAVYYGAPPGERQAAHRAMAEVLAADPVERDLRAWHLGQAAEGPDERVAGILERTGSRSLWRTGPIAAAEAFARAGQLSTSHQRRARRAVAAAAARWHGGDAAGATAMLECAEQLGPLPDAVRLDAIGLRALIDVRAGTPADAMARLQPLVPDLMHLDRRQGLELLMLLAEACMESQALPVWSDDVRSVVERLATSGQGNGDVLARLLRAACRVVAGSNAELEPGDLESAETLTDPRRLCWAGTLSLCLGEADRARRLHGQAVQRARTVGATGTLAWALEHLADDELNRGRFDAAEACAYEGLRLAMEVGQPNTASRHRSTRALLAALRGHELDARRLANGVLATAGNRLALAAATAHRALAFLELAAGRPDGALEHLAIVVDGGARHQVFALRSVPELVEAAARANRPDRAVEPLRQFSSWAEATGAADLMALAARSRALLSSGDAVEKNFQVAFDLHARTEAPFEAARTQLLFGEHLRRERRRTDARHHLRLALSMFRGLGLPMWVDRARDELRAAGETKRVSESTALPALTPQERRIVAAVSEGATNREIAARMFLSARTIDYHLRKVFLKTGARSRAELVRLTYTEP